jgi:hypothetical protein
VIAKGHLQTPQQIENGFHGLGQSAENGLGVEPIDPGKQFRQQFSLFAGQSGSRPLVGRREAHPESQPR